MTKLSKTGSMEIYNHIDLLKNLLDKEKFNNFRLKYYPQWEFTEILKSYIWYIACLIDNICYIVSNLDFFFNNSVDKRLQKGYSQPIHFSLFTTNSIQGKLINHLYNITSSVLFSINDVEEFPASLKKFDEIFFPIFNFLKDYQVNSKKTEIFTFVDSLLNPISFPYVPYRDFLFFHSHYFKNINDFLNFFKKDDGTWISSRGFFLGISYTLYLILGKSKFIENLKSIIIKDLPFINFSQEESGLYFPYSLDSEDENYDFNENIYIYKSKSGILPIYRTISKNLNDYYQHIKKLYDYFNIRKNLTDIDQFEINLTGVNELLEKVPEVDEIYHLPKIFLYQNVCQLNTFNNLADISYFRLVSSGIRDYASKISDKIRMIVFEMIQKNIENLILDNQDFKLIDPKSKYHFLNNSQILPIFYDKKHENFKIYCGYFFEIPTYSDIADHSFWIGHMCFGGNYLGDSKAETQSFEEMISFYNNHKEIFELETYIGNEKLIREWFEILNERQVIKFQPNNPFFDFFNSRIEIENEINLNNFKLAFNRFKKSYETSNKSNKEKKDALEDLAKKMFDLIPRFKVIDINVLTEAEEIDLVVNIQSFIPHIFDILGFFFLIECKNLNEKVDAKQVTSFGEKIISKQLRGGILISRKGITGKKQDEASKRKIRDYANKGIIILSLDTNDINDISKGINPLFVLMRAYCRMYFKGLKNFDN